MKTVLLSVHPNWLELILSGKKTVEVRKTKPKEAEPFRVLLYCTKNPLELAKDKNGNIVLLSRNKKADISDLEILSGKVIAEFVCDKIIDIDYGIEEGVFFDGKHQRGFETNGIGNNPTCLSFIDLENYLTNNKGYGWHISDLKIYDKPKELIQFQKCTVKTTLKDSFIYRTPEKELFTMKRPPQSWCYVEKLG